MVNNLKEFVITEKHCFNKSVIEKCFDKPVLSPLRKVLKPLKTPKSPPRRGLLLSCLFLAAPPPRRIGGRQRNLSKNTLFGVGSVLKKWIFKLRFYFPGNLQFLYYFLLTKVSHLINKICCHRLLTAFGCS